VSQAGTGIARKRIPEIDFWRGFALIVIMVDHVPWNGLDLLTPRNFGFSDAAEVFVFLSGAAVSLANVPLLQKARFGRIVRRCATRAAKLYLVQIALTLCSIAIPLAAATIVGDERVALEQGLSRFLDSPVSSLIGVAALNYFPNISCILALYVVLMLWAPVVLFLAWRSAVLALLVSVGVYALGRGHFRLESDGWYFNPFAWQLVFAIGLVCALTWRDGLPRPQRPLVVLAAAIILGAAILSVRVMGLNAAALAHLDLDKSELGLMRLAHFLAVAYVIAVVGAVEPLATPIRRIIRSWTGQSLQGMGRNSLFFFALGSVVSTGGCSLMAAARSLGTAHLIIHLIGFVYIAAAVVGMFAVVRRMERPTGPLVRSTEIGDALAAPLVYRSAPLPSDKDPDVAPLLAPGAAATKSSPTSI
jgi:hypothetical protein